MSNATHSILLLGTAEFTHDQQLSSILKSPKGVALVSYLIVTGQSQPRELIADLLGDANSTPQALKNLRSLLNRIRQFVPELQVTRNTLAFVPTENTKIDLYQLRMAMTIESPLDAAGAIQLYRNDLLNDFYLAGAPRFNEWLTVERERLRRQVLSFTHTLCQKLFDLQAWQVGMDVARHRLRLDNLDEEGYQWLMRFLAGNGQVGEARQQYELCRRLLWQELGVEPSDATQQIAQQLIDFEPAAPTVTNHSRQQIEWDGLTLPDPAPLPPGSIVPFRRNHDFVGRIKAQHALGQALLKSPTQPNCVAISGLGGLGKTQLAVEFAFRFARFFPGGVYWMSFADPEGVADEVAAIGGARGMQLYESESRLSRANRVDRVRRAWQEPVRRLLIFDNCEDADLLADWLPVSGGCQVLVTTRRGSWPRELGVVTVSLSTLARDSSIALLNKLAPHIGPDDGQAIAAELGDLPLALHLAGGFLHRYPQITAPTYLEQLRHQDLLAHPSLNGRGSAMSPTGHDLHIGRTFAINHAQLDPDNETDVMSLRLLMAAACFASGEPIAQVDLIRATLDKPYDLLTELLASDGLRRLVSLGFIENQGNETVVMHRLVAASVQRENPALYARMFDRVATYLADELSETHKATVYLGDLPLAAAHVHYVVECGLKLRLASAARLSAWYAVHRIDIGNYRGTRRVIDDGIDILRENLPAEALALAHSLNVGGTLLFKQCCEVEAWPYYEESYELCRRELGERHIRTINSLQNLAILHWRTGKLQESLAMFEQALRHHEMLVPSQEQLKIRVMQNIGSVLNLLGRYADAQQYQERVLEVRSRILPPNHPQISETYHSLGVIAYRRGDYQAAVAYFEKVLQIRRQAFGDDSYNLTLPLLNLGQTFVCVDDLSRALIHLEEAVRIRCLSLAEDSPAVAYAMSLIGNAYRGSKHWVAAESYLVPALKILERVWPDRIDTAQAQVNLAIVYMAQGRVEQAETLLQKAHIVYEAVLSPDNPNMALFLNAQGALALLMGNTHIAYDYFDRVRNLLIENVLPTHIELVRALEHLSAKSSDKASPSAANPFRRKFPDRTLSVTEFGVQRG